MDDFELIDVWRTFNQDKKVYTWHSNTRPKIFCRLDFFLLQNHMMNTVVNVEIKNSIKSDHSVVLINIEINNIKRGPGIFKLNNSMLLDIAYKEKVQKAIKDIKDHNNDADPIVLWSLIKGAIRNETISFSSRKQKVEEEKLKKLEQEISNLEQEFEQANNNNNNNNNSNNNDNNTNINNGNPQRIDIDNIDRELTDKKEELNEIYKNKIAGILTRLKMTHIQGGEKNINYLKSLEKQKAESKIISKLIVNGENNQWSKRDFR